MHCLYGIRGGRKKEADFELRSDAGNGGPGPNRGQHVSLWEDGWCVCMLCLVIAASEYQRVLVQV